MLPEQVQARGDAAVILVAENEAVVRRLIAEVLRGQGYSVLEAADGAAALSIIGERRAEIDLLITDVVMPGLSGGALAEKLMEASPTTKLLLISGYVGSPLVRAAASVPGSHFLQKPFTPTELCAKVRGVLQSTATTAVRD